MRRLLIVSPHFPPVNLPDLHRVRMMLPYLQGEGWEPVVLTLDPSQCGGVRDEQLLRAVPGDLRVLTMKLSDSRWRKLAGVRSTALRMLSALSGDWSGRVRSERADLAFFSTTAFPVFAAGPRWKKKFGLTYVLDFQDPWRKDVYEKPGAPPPPGGKWRYRIGAKLPAAMLEPGAVRHAAHIISTTAAYAEDLAARYGIPSERFSVEPFCASEEDVRAAAAADVVHGCFDRSDGLSHWVFAGAAGPAFERPLRILLRAFAQWKAAAPEHASGVRLHFIGTSYDQQNPRPAVLSLAQELEVAEHVREQPRRLGYLSAMKAAMEGSAILQIGHNDPQYSPTKIYPNILLRRPMLSLYHEESPAVAVLRGLRAGEVHAYGSEVRDDALIEALCASFDRLLLHGSAPAMDWETFRPHTAQEMTRRLCKVFERCVAVAEVAR